MEVSDDGFWRKLSITPESGYVCSYNFKGENTTRNIYEIKFDNYDNVLVGVYYYSAFADKVIDLGLVDPANCMNVRHCIKSEKGYIMFVLDNAEYVSINLVP